MAYPPKLKKLAIQLHIDEGLSAESIVYRLSKNAEWKSSKIPDPRTVRLWFERERDIPEQALTDEIRERDRLVFKKLNKIMSHKNFWEYFYSLRAGAKFTSEVGNNISKYEYYAQFEDYKFVYKRLGKLHERFLKCLSDLEQFMFPHTFTMDGSPDRIKVHYPEFGDIHWRGYSEDELEQMFVEFESKFNKLIDNADRAYSTYRKTVKDTLII